MVPLTLTSLTPSSRAFLPLLLMCILTIVEATKDIQFSGETKFLVLPVECADVFLVDFDFTHGACIKRTLSKTIGYVIMVAAAILKVPQMLIILRAKDVTGISFVGQYFELLSFTNGYITSKALFMYLYVAL